MFPSLGPYLGLMPNTLVYMVVKKSMGKTYWLVVPVGQTVGGVREVSDQTDCEWDDHGSVNHWTVIAL